MQILYISSVPSYKEFCRIKGLIKDNINVTTYGMNESGFKFHSLIIDGLLNNEDVNVLSLVGRSVHKKTHKGIVWKTITEQKKQNIEYKHLGFINIPVIKQFGLGLSFFYNTIKWIKLNKNNEKHIIIDASYVTVIPFIILATKLWKCKKTAIFCDIYEYMGKVKDARDSQDISLLHKVFRTIMCNAYRQIDSFVLLTEHMNQVINPLQKPYIVMEGLVDIHMSELENKRENKEPHDVIMYAGALREQYGLKNLVEGFMQYHNTNAYLWIFGAGDYSAAIADAAKIDQRIVFFGLAQLQDVVEREIQATVLINPRSADLEFTQYSFPSKNMEYMVSGTPILTTRLPGMPEEYYDYIFTIDGNDSYSITEALIQVFALTKEELHKKGLSAKNYVLSNKNNITQSRRILDLLRSQ